MASDTGDAFGRPRQSIRDKEDGRVRQILVAVIDHQPLFPQVAQTMGMAVTRHYRE